MNGEHSRGIFASCPAQALHPKAQMDALSTTSSFHSSCTIQASSLPTPPSITSIPRTQAWFFTPQGIKDPVSPAARVWEDGRLSQGEESTPGELRASSDLALTVLVDTPLRLPPPSPTGLRPGPQTHQAHSCLMAFAHAVLSAWKAELPSSHGSFFLILFLVQMPPQKTFPGHPSVILGDIILLFL